MKLCGDRLPQTGRAVPAPPRPASLVLKLKRGVKSSLEFARVPGNFPVGCGIYVSDNNAGAGAYRRLVAGRIPVPTDDPSLDRPTFPGLTRPSMMNPPILLPLNDALLVRVLTWTRSRRIWILQPGLADSSGTIAKARRHCTYTGPTFNLFSHSLCYKRAFHLKTGERRNRSFSWSS